MKAAVSMWRLSATMASDKRSQGLKPPKRQRLGLSVIFARNLMLTSKMDGAFGCPGDSDAQVPQASQWTAIDADSKLPCLGWSEAAMPKPLASSCGRWRRVWRTEFS